MSYTVAVIIPTYNRVSTLQRALDSVLAQTLPIGEICVIDDGSDDGSKELIASKFPNVSYYYQENAGVSSARNLGIAKTESDWLAFLDSDDEWLPQKLELQLEALKECPKYKLIHSEEIWIRNGKRVNQMRKHQKAGGYIFPQCLPLCVISPSAVLIQREMIEDIGGFDESLVACEDYDLWLRICCQERVLYLDTPLLKKYAGHDDQLSKLHWGMDRFRVKAIMGLLESASLDNVQRRLAITTLLAKAKILRNGALKRAKHETVGYYNELISEYTELGA